VEALSRCPNMSCSMLKTKRSRLEIRKTEHWEDSQRRSIHLLVGWMKS
jgi:hypothetical protein